jgi:transaldolase
VDGVTRCWHIEETAGGRVIFTLPPPFLTELFTEANHLKLEPRIRKAIPADVMSRLQKVPYFTAAYEPDGISPPEFNQMPALLSTMKQFRAAMDKIVAFTNETLHAPQHEAVLA